MKKPISLRDTRKYRPPAAQEEENHMTGAKTFIAPSLLQPDNHAVLLVGCQYLQLVIACSHNPQGVTAASTLLARGAKLFRTRARRRAFSQECSYRTIGPDSSSNFRVEHVLVD
jgi:hypothetical protein